MTILQRTISYQGDLATVPTKRIIIEFDVPELAYTTRDIEGGAVVDRKVVGRTPVQQPHALDSAEYRATFASSLLCGRSLEDFAAFRLYSMQAIDARDLEALTVEIDVRYFADGKYPLGGQQLALLCLPLLESFANTSSSSRTNLIRVENRSDEKLRKGLLAINKASFLRLLEQVLAADVAIDERSLIGSIR